MIVAAVVGFGYGLAVVLTFAQRYAPFWRVWMAFAVATATAAGVLTGYGRSRHARADVNAPSRTSQASPAHTLDHAQ
jgi:Na+-driven multidrug efflux pump